MRGYENQQQQLFSYINLEERVPKNHPIRKLKSLVDQVLEKMSYHFDIIYSEVGRPSIPPEQLLKGLLLQTFYTIRSERQLVEHIDANLWYRWFIGLGIDDKVWNASAYSKNRDRLLEHNIAETFFDEVLNLAKEHDLVSDEHFTVDGTLIESLASLKSFKPKDKDNDKDNKPPKSRNEKTDFHGEKRTNKTHQSTTDPESRLYKKGKGKEAKLCFMGHITTENRHGLVVASTATIATGTAEREASINMISSIKPKSKKITLGGDKGYDVSDYTQELRDYNVTPHVAQNDTNRKSSIDGRTTRHKGYNVSQRKRKQVEEVFGWSKTIGGLKKLRHKGLEITDWIFTFTNSAYNLVRMIKLIPV